MTNGTYAAFRATTATASARPRARPSNFRTQRAKRAMGAQAPQPTPRLQHCHRRAERTSWATQATHPALLIGWACLERLSTPAVADLTIPERGNRIAKGRAPIASPLGLCSERESEQPAFGGWLGSTW